MVTRAAWLEVTPEGLKGKSQLWFDFFFFLLSDIKGKGSKVFFFPFSYFKARTQFPTMTNYAVKFPTFGEIAGVSTSGVQWISLALENHIHDHGISPAR